MHSEKKAKDSGLVMRDRRSTPRRVPRVRGPAGAQGEGGERGIGKKSAEKNGVGSGAEKKKTRA